MKHKKVISIITLLAGLAGYWFFQSEQNVEMVLTPVQPVLLPLAPPPTTKQSAIALKPKETQEVEIIPESISESFSLLAEAYAGELTQPSYSIPLTFDDSHLLNPNSYLPQAVLLKGGGNASIVLPKYRFSYPEPIVVTLVVDGIQVTAAKVTLVSELSAAGDTFAKEDMHANGGDFSAQLSPSEDWDGPMEVRVTFSAKGKKQTISTGIEYSYPTATITGVGSVSADGSDMLIPVKIDVKKAGYYRLRANLYRENEQPVALLTSEKKLSEGDVEMELKAFKGALANHSGQFTLTTFVLERRPAVPGELTRYGNSEKPSYDLGDFAVEQLSDEVWQPDEQELQRLEFLKQMAGE